MTETERMTNFDLDVDLALNDFPENGNHAYIYLRAETIKDDVRTYISFSGTQQDMTLGIISAMEEDIIAESVISATISYVSKDKKTVNKLIRLLSKLI